MRKAETSAILSTIPRIVKIEAAPLFATISQFQGSVIQLLSTSTATNLTSTDLTNFLAPGKLYIRLPKHRNDLFWLVTLSTHSDLLLRSIIMPEN